MKRPQGRPCGLFLLRPDVQGSLRICGPTSAPRGTKVDLQECILYRMAYGLAADLAEADRENFPGRLRSNRAAGGTAGTILAEVCRRLDQGRGVDRDVIREGVADALEGRRPRR